MSSLLWIKVAGLSCYGHIILPTTADKNDYILLSGGYIWKYTVDDDSWSKSLNTSDMIGWNISDNTSAALSKDKNDLYIYTCLFSDKAKFIHINLQNKAYETLDIKHSSGSLSKIIMIDNTLNIIGGRCSNMHLKWNEKDKQFNGDIIMYDKTKISGFGLIYTNNPKKHLLLFGGYDDNKNTYVDYGLEFNFETQKWNKLPIQLPNKWRISCTLAIRNQFVFIIGGYSIDDDYSNDIHIYNIRN
eukprot:461219_1